MASCRATTVAQALQHAHMSGTLPEPFRQAAEAERQELARINEAERKVKQEARAVPTASSVPCAHSLCWREGGTVVDVRPRCHLRIAAINFRFATLPLWARHR